MSIRPEPGLIVRYDFLWKEEERRGLEDGLKDRPCAIILASKPRADGSIEVVLCPITHSPPNDSQTAVAIPAKVSRALGLDDEQSWIKTHQVNTLIWPEGQIPFGITPARFGEWSFGRLPQALGRAAFEQVRNNAQAGQLQSVPRKD